MTSGEAELNPYEAAQEPLTAAIPVRGWVTFHVVLHGLPWGGLLLVYLFVVPRFALVFDDFGLDLPQMTVMSASALVARYWYLALALMLMGLALDYRVLTAYTGRRQWHWARFCWLLVMVGLPILNLALTMAALFVPLMNLTQSLGG
jgi:type II secretory pathway component PulF